MDAKLKVFLRSKGVSEEAIAKIEQGDAPDDPEERLRKIDPDSPVLTKIGECRDLLDDIKKTVASILKADAHRESTARGAELHAEGLMNGHDALDLPNLLKGLRP